MIVFRSSHQVPGRVYRITSPGDYYRLAKAEYYNPKTGWRPARNENTRHIAHCLAQGSPSASLTREGAESVTRLADAVELLPEGWAP